MLSNKFNKNNDLNTNDMDSLINAAKNSNSYKDDAPDIVKDTTKQNNVSFLQFKQNAKKKDKPKEAKAEG